MRICLAILLVSLPVRAALVQFEWGASPFSSNQKITYRVYAYPDSGGTNMVSDAGGSLTVSVPFGPGAWNAYVVAVSTNGIESDPSNILHFIVPWPPTLKLTSTIEKAQSPDGPWVPLMGETAEVKPDGTNQFFRMKLKIAQP